ncbi:hypothetical protein ACFL6I_24710 [candidate division KSB1 bacterium]
MSHIISRREYREAAENLREEKGILPFWPVFFAAVVLLLPLLLPAVFSIHVTYMQIGRATNPLLAGNPILQWIIMGCVVLTDLGWFWRFYRKMLREVTTIILDDYLDEPKGMPIAQYIGLFIAFLINYAFYMAANILWSIFMWNLCSNGQRASVAELWHMELWTPYFEPYFEPVTSFFAKRVRHR